MAIYITVTRVWFAGCESNLELTKFDMYQVHRNLFVIKHFVEQSILHNFLYRLVRTYACVDKVDLRSSNF